MRCEVFRIVVIFVACNPAKVWNWELQDAGKKLGKEWSQDLAGQDICADKYTFKERYYICYEATKPQKKTAPLLNRLELGADSELRRIRCRERKVYFSYRYRNGTYLSATRLLYPCPIADPDRNEYLFGQGKHRNEIGVYREVYKEEGDKEIWFHGVMKDINLDTFGKQLYRKNIRLIH